MNTLHRPRHDVPHWVNRDSAVYHIRISIERSANFSLVNPPVARTILQSVDVYTETGKWWAETFLLMPDHLHALISFDPARNFSVVVGAWKKWHRTRNNIPWQENFFDHRIRSDESLRGKAEYIRNNPVRAGLVENQSDWPWWTSSHEELRFPREKYETDEE